MSRLSLGARLTLFYSLMLTAMLAVFGFLFYHSLTLIVDRNLTEELRQRAVFLDNYLRVSGDTMQLAADPRDREETYLVHSAERYYQIFRLPSGDLVVQSKDVELLGLSLTPDQVRHLAASGELTDLQLNQEH